jgi:hypothetical protein
MGGGTASDVPDLPLVPTIGELFDSGAFLNAVVTSNGGVTTVVLEYGTTTAYGTTAPASQSPLAGTAIAEFVSALIGGLTADTTYHWRVSATNSAGTTTSSDQVFKTLPAGTIFFDPLFNSLTPTTAGNPTPTFTRATTAYATAIPANGNSASDQLLILCAAGEARFQGARRIAANNWSRVYNNNKVISPDTMQGYVTEDAATNKLLWSQDLTNAAWAKTAVVVTANTTVAPDGTTTADTLTDDATSSAHNVSNSPGFGGVCSVYLKAGTLTWIQVWSTNWANFNIVTGTKGNSSGAGATITPVGNGWFRCSIVGTSGALRIYCAPSDVAAGQPSYVGTGQTVFVWGGQLEQGQVLTSYIPTTSAQVTRNADDLQYAMVSNLDGALGTTYAEVIMPPLGTVDRSVIRVFASAKYAHLYVGPSNFLRMNGTAAITTANSAAAANVLAKGATAWSGATASLCLNGGTVATGAFTSYTNSGNIGIGSTEVASSNFCGPIRNIRIYNARITDANLIPLTAIAPTVVTGAATSVTATGATLNGTVTSNGLPTTVDFQYGKTTNYNKTATAAQSPLAANAVSSAVSVVLTGLQVGTLYHFRVVGTNSSGSTYGADGTFTPAAAPTDPFFANVTLLLHCEGTNGSTTFTDSSSSPKSVVAGGSSAISTARAKFGSSSILGGATGFFTATLGVGGSMTGDFTWETWAWGGLNNVLFYSTVPNAYLYNDIFTGYGGPDLAVTTNFSAAWHHVAISRVGSTIRGFLDGVLTGTQTFAGTVDLTTLVCGKYVPNGNLFWTTNYDDMRVTKGVGRYTANFTPPTAAFPDS